MTTRYLATELSPEAPFDRGSKLVCLVPTSQDDSWDEDPDVSSILATMTALRDGEQTRDDEMELLYLGDEDVDVFRSIAADAPDLETAVQNWLAHRGDSRVFILWANDAGSALSRREGFALSECLDADRLRGLVEAWVAWADGDCYRPVEERPDGEIIYGPTLYGDDAVAAYQWGDF